MIEAKISVKIIDGEKWLMNFASSSICIQLVSISCFNFVIRTNVLTENNRLLSIDAKVSVRTVVSEEWWRKLVIFRASLSNFFPVHIKVVLKPVWTYGIQLWGTASNSNRNSSTIPIKNPSMQLPTKQYNLKIPRVKEEICKFSDRYKIRINNHENPLITPLLDYWLDAQVKKTSPYKFKHYIQLESNTR